MRHEQFARRAYETWGRRELDAFLEMLHPDFEVRPTMGASIGGTVYRGHEGARQWFADVHQEWELLETRMDWIQERGDRVLCAFQVHGRGRASGVVVVGELFHVVDMRDGLIARIDGFQEREAAVIAFESA